MKGDRLSESELRRLIDGCTQKKEYLLGSHFKNRSQERKIPLPVVLDVVKNGTFEDHLSRYNEAFDCWSYSFSMNHNVIEKTIRVVVSFHENYLFFVTSMIVEKNGKEKN